MMNPIDKYSKLSGDILECSGSKLAFFKGSLTPDVLILGEAPGPQENIEGIPFIGECGREIEYQLQQSGLSSFKIAYLNSVFRMPIDNRSKFRKPSEDEVNYYKPMVDEIIKFLKPKFIIACGNVACFSIIGQQGIMKIRGKWFSNIMPTFHPGYILRNSDKRLIVISDMNMVCQALAPNIGTTSNNQPKSIRRNNSMNESLTLSAIAKLAPKFNKELKSIKSYINLDPQISISKGRKLLEALLKGSMDVNVEGLHNQIKELSGTIPETIESQMHFIRKLGNTAVHSDEIIDSNVSRQNYEMLLTIVCWHFNIKPDELKTQSARFFIADAVYKTWPKIAILTQDGKLYSEYLSWMKPTTFEKDGFDFNSFKCTDFSFGEAEHGNSYQSLREVSYEEAIHFTLKSQANWVNIFLTQHGIDLA